MIKDKIWSNSSLIETPQKIKDFYKEYCDLCKKHKMSLSHEDGHGGFIFDENDLEFNLERVGEASYEPHTGSEEIQFNFDECKR